MSRSVRRRWPLWPATSGAAATCGEALPPRLICFEGAPSVGIGRESVPCFAGGVSAGIPCFASGVPHDIRNPIQQAIRLGWAVLVDAYPGQKAGQTPAIAGGPAV